MVSVTIHDYWLLPQHEQLVGEILKGIESISPHNREQRRQRTDEVRKIIQAKIKDFTYRGDARFVSRSYTVISRQVEINIEGNREWQEIWRDLMGDYRPDYPASPVKEEILLPAKNVLEDLPDGSWLISMKIKLGRQFTSKDETDFHFSDNPIVRDHLTGLPMARPTTWKGHLRHTARMIHNVVEKAQEPPVLKRLFGDTKGEEGGVEGRLHFFPTFFTGTVQREVITPLKRDTRTPVPGRGPIDIEIAPMGTEGTFCLLYLPIPKGQGWSSTQIAEDLEAIASALRSMFLEYGFSAKKTSGWGLVKDNLKQEGRIWVKGKMWPREGEQGSAGADFQEPAHEWLPLMDTTGNPKPQLLKPDCSFLSNSEFRDLSPAPTSLNVYKRFRGWYEAHGAEWRRRKSSGQADDIIHEYSYCSIAGLEALLKRLAEALHREGANG